MPGLADTIRWRIETNNIGELQMTRGKLGRKTPVTVNIFPGQKLTAKVIAASPTPIVQQGNTTCAATIELEETKLPLRWKMMAKVKILVKD
jgi:hypothetical protein